jgi:hypothetical protein
MGRYKKSILEYDDVILAVDYAKKEGIEIGEKRTLNINITSNEDVLQNQSNQTMLSRGKTLAASPVCEIKLFNITGSQVRHTSSQTGSIALDVSGLPNGLYILHVHDGTNNPPLTQSIIVYH